MNKDIISISLGPSHLDYEFSTHIFGKKVHVRRIGTDGNVQRARELVTEFDGQVDAIGLGGVSLLFRIGNKTFVHKQIKTVVKAARTTPVVDGIHIKNTLERWSISQLAQQEKSLFKHKRVFFLSGIEHFGIAQVLNGFTSQISFGDPIFHLNLPFVLKSFDQLERYAKLVMPILCRLPALRLSQTSQRRIHSKPRITKYFNQANVIVAESDFIRKYAINDLKGKTMITNPSSSSDVNELRSSGAESLITLTPQLSKGLPFVTADVIEAIFVSFLDSHHKTTDDDYLDLASQCKLKPRFIVLNKPRDIARFAHVIHPLNTDYIFSQPKLKFLRFLPHRLVERQIAKIRPRCVSRITGIRSPVTGKDVEGFLISLGATPRELMRRKPGFTYSRLILASRMAQQMGAKIMSLGAFTKIVGDAGISVSYKSDIAITSGNSLTVSATLEAAKQAVLKMGGRIDRGRAVIIGATGSIGSVCSRMLAQACRDVVLVAPRPEKLIELKKIIEEETPEAKVTITSHSASYLPDADLVVTTTSAFGQKIIDVLKLKPGCIVCDVASPPDVRKEDARLRPDVLVIEAGEIKLPGNPDVGFNIGLPPGVVHACLAESALLAMEGRFENFTLGRGIEIEGVKEIYRLFKKHGLKLAGMRSFGQYVTDKEIAQKRKMADYLRKHPEKIGQQISKRLIFE